MAAKSEPTTEIAVFEKFQILQQDASEIADVLDANLGGEPINVNDLPAIKTPAGGGTIWSVPSAGKPIGTDTLEAVILFTKRTRAYWSSQTAQRGTPPDCTSDDCMTGHGDNGEGEGAHDCGSCPMAEWGSKDGGRGIACRETRILYLLFPHMNLPMALRVPPTSLKAAREYLLSLSSLGLPYHKVLTRISLKKGTNPQGQDYSQLVFEMGDVMDVDVHAKMKALASFYQPQLKRAPVRESTRPEYDVEGVDV